MGPRKIATDISRLTRACGNLIIVDEETQLVQLAHYTVQQYLLRPGHSNFHFAIHEASSYVGEVCVSYLSFRNFDSQVTRYRDNSNTDMFALSKIASRGTVMASVNPGRKMVNVWNALRSFDPIAVDVDMTRYLPRPPSKPFELSSFSLLS